MVDFILVEAIVANFGLSFTHEHAQQMLTHACLHWLAQSLILSLLLHVFAFDWSAEHDFEQLLCIFRNLFVAAANLGDGLLQKHSVNLIVSHWTDKKGQSLMGRNIIINHHISDVSVSEQPA